MWDVIWYLGFPLFAINVFGAPYKKHYEYDKNSPYRADQYDVIFDQRQNGSENYRVNVDGLSLVWSPNSLLAAAALLEPALYGEYPDANIDVLFGDTSSSKPETQPVSKPQEEGTTSQENKPSDERPDKLGESKPSENKEPLVPTILVIDANQTSGQTPASTDTSTTSSKRKLRIPGLLRPFLRKRSSLAAEPVKVVHNVHK